MGPLAGMRFVQVGAGPVPARAGTLLALLGADVVAAVDADDGARVLAQPAAVDHAGRAVWIGAPSEVRTLTPVGIIDGSGQVPVGAGVVDVSRWEVGAAGWAASGAMSLTGHSDGPPLVPPADVTAGLHAAAAVVELLSDLGGRRVRVDGPALLGDRAALTGRARRGRTSVGGAARLLPAADGWVAVNLPRATDIELVDAWLGTPPGDDHWRTIAEGLATRPMAETVAAGQELGLAVASVQEPDQVAIDGQARHRAQRWPMAPFLVDDAVPPLPPAHLLDLAPDLPAGGGTSGARTERSEARTERSGARTERSGARTDHGASTGRRARTVVGRRVVDLSSLWAGPLATSLVADAGAEVVKVEGANRPDGARRGNQAFFALLNAGKRSVTVDLTPPRGADDLAAILARADLVVEGSRPRALEQLGFDPQRWRSDHPGASWLSITAYGRTGPQRQWVGFGDDSGVAGGLVARDDHGDPVFCGDAFGDPAGGLHAAAAALACLVGRGANVDLGLREVVNHLLATPAPTDPDGGAPPAAAPARARPSRGDGPAFGEGNGELLGAEGAPA